MNERYEEIFGYNGTMCDCCGVTEPGQELHTLEGNCGITLCRECILQFYAMIDRRKKRNIIRIETGHVHSCKTEKQNDLLIGEQDFTGKNN